MIVRIHNWPCPVKTVPWKDDQDDPVHPKPVRVVQFSVLDETQPDEDGNPTTVIGMQTFRVESPLGAPQIRDAVGVRAKELLEKRIATPTPEVIKI